MINFGICLNLLHGTINLLFVEIYKEFASNYKTSEGNRKEIAEGCMKLKVLIQPYQSNWDPSITLMKWMKPNVHCILTMQLSNFPV